MEKEYGTVARVYRPQHSFVIQQKYVYFVSIIYIKALDFQVLHDILNIGASCRISIK